jgi:hypothetical protein
LRPATGRYSLFPFALFSPTDAGCERACTSRTNICSQRIRVILSVELPGPLPILFLLARVSKRVVLVNGLVVKKFRL